MLDCIMLYYASRNTTLPKMEPCESQLRELCMNETCAWENTEEGEF